MTLSFEHQNLVCSAPLFPKLFFLNCSTENFVLAAVILHNVYSLCSWMQSSVNFHFIHKEMPVITTFHHSPY